MKKRLLSVTLILAMTMGVMAGCSQKVSKESEVPADTTSAASTEKATTAADTEPATETAAKTVEWGKEPVNFYYPSGAGGGIDSSMRLIGEYLQENDNITLTHTCNSDGGGAVVFETVRNAKPDGYTLMGMHFLPFVKYYTGLYNVNPLDAWDVVGVFSVENPYVALVSADSPINNAKDLAAYITENPGEMICGIEMGGSAQMMAACFAMDCGGSFKYVEAGNTSAKVAALAGGNIDITFAGAYSCKQYIDDGTLKQVGVITADGQRSTMFPDWETFYEAGFKNTTWSVDTIIYGPHGMDEDLKNGIMEYLNEACMSDGVQEGVKKMSQPMVPSGMDTAEAQEYVRTEAEKIKGIVRSVGLLKNE